MGVGRDRSSGAESRAMVHVTVTRFTGAGPLVIVVGEPREAQSEQKPALRVIRGG